MYRTWSFYGEACSSNWIDNSDEKFIYYGSNINAYYRNSTIITF